MGSAVATDGTGSVPDSDPTTDGTERSVRGSDRATTGLDRASCSAFDGVGGGAGGGGGVEDPAGLNLYTSKRPFRNSITDFP